MYKILSLGLLLATLLCPAAEVVAQDVNALVIVPRYYGANLNFNLDNFNNFGWNVTLVGVSSTLPACPTYGGPRGCPPINVDMLVSEVGDLSTYQVVAIMPGSMWVSVPYGDLLASQEVLDLISEAVAEGLVVFAPCGGVRILAAADVLDGINVTGHRNFRSEYEAAGAIYVGANHAPVIDGTIVTATRGMYFHEANCEAISIALERSQKQGLRGLR